MFPVLVVDEYQDLGVALHRIVKRIAFDGGVRLFAVGDPDQSIYGFTGADGALLQELTEREDVERVQLQLKYRSASRIVSASEMALGEARGYQSNDPDRQAVIEFVECDDGLEGQPALAVADIIPAALVAKPGRSLGDIAILNRDYRAGDIVSDAVAAAGLDLVRVDTAAPYRKVALTSWIEDCAAWCSGGWQEAQPRLHGLLDRWLRFHRTAFADGEARAEAQRMTQLLWSLRTDDGLARDFVAAMRARMLDALMTMEPSLADQREQVDRMLTALSAGGPLHDLDVASLGGRDGSPRHLNLLILHSAKGCEYDVVIMVGLDLGATAGVKWHEIGQLENAAITGWTKVVPWPQAAKKTMYQGDAEEDVWKEPASSFRPSTCIFGTALTTGSLPWRNERPAARRESRRLFYVGLTRARDEIHMLYSGFVDTPPREDALGSLPIPQRTRSEDDRSREGLISVIHGPILAGQSPPVRKSAISLESFGI